jgi:hypothetical protein
MVIYLTITQVHVQAFFNFSFPGVKKGMSLPLRRRTTATAVILDRNSQARPTILKFAQSRRIALLICLRPFPGIACVFWRDRSSSVLWL